MQKAKGKQQKAETRHSTPPRVWLAAAGIVAAGIWAYSNGLAGAFVFDDTPGIADNPHIRSLWPLTRAMSAPPEVTVAGRPVAALSLALNYALAPVDVRDVMTSGGRGVPAGTEARYRANVRGYHLFNLGVHLLAGLALFGVVRRTLLSERMRDRFREAATPLAFVVALLWIVHPLHTESVTYIVQRVESLMGLFYLLTLYCAIRAWEGNRRWELAAVAACTLGMGSKEVMVSAPMVVVLWDWVFASRRRWAFYAGLAATWFVLAMLVWIEPRGRSVGWGLEGWTAWSYLLTQSEVIVHYLALAVSPLTIVIDYGWPRASSVAAVWPELLGLSIALAMTIVAIVRRHPLGFAGAAFFLILAPSSSVLPIVTEIAAEHRMYLPLAALVSAVVVGGYAVVQRAGRSLAPSHWARAIAKPAAIGVVAVAALMLGLMTRHRNLDYSSQESLWRDAVLKRPANARARVTYGLELLRQGRHAEAETELRTAVRLDEANAAAQLNLGVVLCSSGKFAEGIPRLERAIALDPDNAQIYGNLGEAYAAQGQFGRALKHFLQALASRPDDVFLLNRAGWLLATSGDGQVRDGSRAIEMALRAIRLTSGQDVESLDTLAAAYAETDRFSDAVSTATEAIRLARLQGRADILPEIEARLRLYQSGQKFRQAP